MSDTTIDGTWHRTHRLSPILKSWKSVGFLAVLVLTQARRLIENALEGASDNADSPTHFVHAHPQLVIGALIGFVVLMIVVVIISTISWRRYAYLIDDENIRVRGGIFVKKDEHARLARVQSVDVLEPLVARLLGLAILRFDVAGGRASSLDIAYLKRAEAMAMRTHILTQVRSLKDGAPAGPGALNENSVEDDEVDEYTPRRMPERDVAGLTQAPRGANVIRALAANTRTISHDVSDALAETLAPYRIRISPDDEGRIVRVPPHNVIFTRLIPRVIRIGLLIALCLGIYAICAHYGHGKDSLSFIVPILLGSLLSLGNVIKTANAYMNFSIAITPDGLLVTRGATTTLRRVIPLDRIQALKVTQPLLWRPFGWWQIEFNMAGNSAHEEMHESVLLPVGTLDDVLVILGLVLPEPGLPTGVSPADVAIAALTGRASTDSMGVFHTQPGSARLFDPLTHSRNAWCCSDTFLLIRGGFLRRWATFTPHARVQSLSLEEGPLQRWRHLATVRLHSTKGPVHARMHHYDAALMDEFITKHAQITRAARAQLDDAPLRQPQRG